MNKISGVFISTVVAIVVFVAYYLFAAIEYFSTNAIKYAPIAFYAMIAICAFGTMIWFVRKSKKRQTIAERIRRGLLVPDRVR